ncbi:hypothetical protein SSBR45G_18070 [Bradyrhizobium sp. SSBR45G]|uniref:hypothetical protein n=1 Tax=unclassified Bradyrhizobium TaxID=2631580 RepID=UPI0023428EC2|nr:MULTISPECIES: hypothetical protein [unclassified Bradyrhizobium]GLH76899.1 hypothetical protein SSBR45G_18070 [Bradyrhizobium sp. SSBR45G]GLH83657.1 hypothetical protein SSBR45R_11170 [Bradyrhizobium sp. SSBR45R]
MRLDSAQPATATRHPRIPPALKALADEVCGTFARLIAYVGALALIAMLGVAGWNRLDGGDDAGAPRAGWILADSAVPAFSLRLTDQPDRTATYTVLSHPAGGRKDVLRWGERADRPAAEIEVYRIGPERDGMRNPIGHLAARMGRPAPDLEAAGIIDSRFGPVSLLRQAGTPDGPGACLGFLKTIAVPALRISGWSCQGAAMQTRRAAVGCMLNRLTLLSPSGHDPALTELFAQAEPRRADCDAPGVAKTLNDWITALDNPRLRGTF